MQSLVISRESGNIPQKIEGRDHYSGLLFLYDDTSYSSAGHPQDITLSSATEASAAGFDTSTYEGSQVQQAFALNPGLVLYVSHRPRTTKDAVIEIQSEAKGELRQVGVVDMTGAAPTKATVADLQRQAQALDEAAMPLSIILAPAVESASGLPTDLRGAAPNVSIMIGGDPAHEGKPAIGALIGVLSARAVNESVAWVQRCRTGLSEAVLTDGTRYADQTQSALTGLDEAGYIYTRTYPGITGCYFSDSHTLDSATGDYAYIERERTMDKAVRGTRTNLLPELGRPLAFNADGSLRADTLQHLRTVAGKAVEQMEKDGEVSGWAVDVDPEQDVLGTSTVKFSVHAVPMGVMRKAAVSIGFAQSVEQ